MNLKLMLLLFLSGFSISGHCEFIFKEGFEEKDSLENLKKRFVYANVELELIHPGQLSDNALRIKKKNPAGYGEFIYNTVVSKEAAGHWLRLSADVRTGFVGNGAEYSFRVFQKKAGLLNGPVLNCPFNDGVARISGCGGINKTPQTLGKWKKTFHYFQLKEGTDEIALSMSVSGGAQVLDIDNVTIEDMGISLPPPERPMVLEEKINWPYGLLELGNLLPGAVYSIEVDIIMPDTETGLIRGEKSPEVISEKRPPADGAGMGVAMKCIRLDGALAPPVQLSETVLPGNRIRYRLCVSPDAVKLRLDFHNDDLIRFNHAQITAQARRWGILRIYLENTGANAEDTAYWPYVYSGRPELKPSGFCELTPFDINLINESLSKRDDLHAAVVKYMGGMCVKLNGKRIPPVFHSYIDYAQHFRHFDELAKKGNDIILVHHPSGGAALHGDWKGKGIYDFHSIDENIYEALSQCSGAKIIYVIDNIHVPYWWAKENQDELARDQDGNFVCIWGNLYYKRTFGKFHELMTELSNKTDLVLKARKAEWFGFFLVSNASEKYRLEMAKYLAALRCYIESRPYGKAVIGYQLNAGYDSQWGDLQEEFGYSEKGDVHVLDFSLPMQRRFRRFLKEKYQTDAALKKAWRNDSVTFETASVPIAEKRNMDQFKTGEYLLNPANDQDVIDFRECQGIVNGELLDSFCKAIKEAASKSVITSAYYPDLLESATGGTSGAQSRRGQSVVYGGKWLDCVAGPAYQSRDVGQTGRTNVMLDSARINGKLHISEIDYRIFTVGHRNYANNILFDSGFKTWSVLQREYMRQICCGYGSWTFDMGFGWFNDPFVADMFKEIRKVFARTIEYDRTSNAKIAIFASEYAKFAQADARRGIIPYTLTSSPVIASYQAGVPVDHYLMNDLEKAAEKHQYRVYYFPMAYALSPLEVGLIESLKRDGNILVFGFAAGYLTDNISIENVEKLTGFKMGTMQGMGLTVQIKDAAYPLCSGMKDFFLGSAGRKDYELGMPRIFVNDRDAVSLAEFCNTDKAGIAVKDHGSWKGVYLGFIGDTPPELIRGIARFAGVHIYNEENDVMFFNKSMVAIHASSNGRKRIILPREAFVTSMWDSKEAGRMRVIERDMKIGENALYCLEE